MIAAIRIRGLKHVEVKIRHTLESLNLDRKNHAVVIPMRAETQGMLDNARDYIAYGPLTAETLARLLEKRGRLSGDARLTPEFLTKHKMASYADLAKALLEGKTTLKDMGIKPVFRLNAPKKGFSVGGTKKGVELKGPLGFHASGVDPLLVKMM